MSIASSPFDPNASDDLPNPASLAITILPPPEPPPILLPTFPPLPMHLLVVLVAQRSDVLKVKINDGEQWDVADLIIPNLLIEVGSAAVSSPSLYDSQESPHPSSPGHNDLTFSSESEDDSDASKSEDDFDDSCPDSSPLRPQPHEHAPTSLSEGANSSLHNPFSPPSTTNLSATSFTLVEGPAEVDDILGQSTANTATLAAQERLWRVMLDDTDLGVDVADGGTGSGTEHATKGVQVVSTEEMAIGGMMDIPSHDVEDN
ncbi:hypothetical protein Dimus_016348 [Dionaea muscipula]